jgi:hypothetical protein
MMTMIVSQSLDFGSGLIMSIDISCQGFSGMGSGFNGICSGL